MNDQELRSLVGHHVIDARGRSVGYLECVFNDDETGRPELIGVLTGRIRRHRVLLPANGLARAGGSLRVPWTKDRVKTAPTYEDAVRSGPLGLGPYSMSISKEKEQAAHAHFGGRDPNS
jgi:hypothetical protein